MIKCYGCGALLQTEDREKLGFVPKEKLENGLCERCFRLVHYNDLRLVDLEKKEEVLKRVNKSHAYAFFLVDLFHINEEVMAMYHQIQIDKCLLFTKVDLLPKSLSFEKIKLWLHEVYQVEDCLFVSAAKQYNIKGILHILEEEKKKEAYLLGCTNAGKSTLVNALVNTSITTSIVPNTTLDFLRIPLENDFVLFDTPGFQPTHFLYSPSDLNRIKKVNGNKRLRPVFYPLKKGASVIIEDLIRIENKGDTCHLIFYIPNSLSIGKVYEKNMFMKTCNSVSFFFQKNEDLVLKGLGFATCKTEGILEVYVRDEASVEKRKSFFDKE